MKIGVIGEATSSNKSSITSMSVAWREKALNLNAATSFFGEFASGDREFRSGGGGGGERF